MDNSRATTKYVRISPRKARLAANLIRGLPVQAAVTQLELCGLKGGRLLKKTLDSAVANAEQQEQRAENLVVVKVYVDEGPRLKRSKPKNRGGRHPICKRTSHFTVIVG